MDMMAQARSTVSKTMRPPSSTFWKSCGQKVPPTVRESVTYATESFMAGIIQSRLRSTRSRITTSNSFRISPLCELVIFWFHDLSTGSPSRHNGAALSVVKTCLQSLPNAKSVAYFDTTFHTTIPLHISTYAIDQAIASQKGLKKYGFHGLSCMSIPSSQFFDS